MNSPSYNHKLDLCSRQHHIGQELKMTDVFLADPAFTLSGVEGLCFGALCDRNRAFADAVAGAAI